jgi:hypothetical protein
MSGVNDDGDAMPEDQQLSIRDPSVSLAAPATGVARLSSQRRQREPEPTKEDKLKYASQEDKDRYELFANLTPEQKRQERELLLAFDSWCGPGNRIDDEEERENALELGLVPQEDAVTVGGMEPRDTIKLHGRCFSRDALWASIRISVKNNVPILFPVSRVSVTELDLLRLGFEKPSDEFLFLLEEKQVRIAAARSLGDGPDNEELGNGARATARTNKLLEIANRPGLLPTDAGYAAEKTKNLAEFEKMLDEPLGYYYTSTDDIEDVVTSYYDVQANKTILFAGFPQASPYPSFILDNWLSVGIRNHIGGTDGRVSNFMFFDKPNIGVVPTVQHIVFAVQIGDFDTALTLMDWRGHGLMQFGMTAIRSSADVELVLNALQKIDIPEETLNSFLQAENVDPLSNPLTSTIKTRGMTSVDIAKLMFEAAINNKAETFAQLAALIGGRRNTFAMKRAVAALEMLNPRVLQIRTHALDSLRARAHFDSEDFQRLVREITLLNTLSMPGFRARVRQLNQVPIRRTLLDGANRFTLTFATDDILQLIDPILIRRGDNWREKVSFLLDWKNAERQSQLADGVRAYPTRLTPSTVIAFFPVGGRSDFDSPDTVVLFHKILSRLTVVDESILVLTRDLSIEAQDFFCDTAFQYIPASQLVETLVKSASRGANRFYIEKWQKDFGGPSVNRHEVELVLDALIELAAALENNFATDSFVYHRFDAAIYLLELMFDRAQGEIDQTEAEEEVLKIALHKRAIVDLVFAPNFGKEIEFGRDKTNIEYMFEVVSEPDAIGNVQKDFFPSVDDLVLGRANRGKKVNAEFKFTQGRMRRFVESYFTTGVRRFHGGLEAAMVVVNQIRQQVDTYRSGRVEYRVPQLWRTVTVKAVAAMQPQLPSRVILESNGSLQSRFSAVDRLLRARFVSRANDVQYTRFSQRLNALFETLVTVDSLSKMLKDRSDLLERIRTVAIAAFTQPVNYTEQDANTLSGLLTNQEITFIIGDLFRKDRVLYRLPANGYLPEAVVRFDGDMAADVMMVRRANGLSSLKDSIFTAEFYHQQIHGLSQSMLDVAENPPFESLVYLASKTPSWLNIVISAAENGDAVTPELATAIASAIRVTPGMSKQHLIQYSGGADEKYRFAEFHRQKAALLLAAHNLEEARRVFERHLLVFNDPEFGVWNPIAAHLIQQMIAFPPAGFTLGEMLAWPEIRRDKHLPGLEGTRAIIQSNDAGIFAQGFADFDKYRYCYPSDKTIRSMLAEPGVSIATAERVESLLQAFVPRVSHNANYEVAKVNRAVSKLTQALDDAVQDMLHRQQ